MKPHLLLYIALAAIMTGCTGSSKSDGGTGISRKPQPSDSLYTLQAAMSIYAYQPVRALQIVDSAVIVGTHHRNTAYSNRRMRLD